jgi:hypothetical protein
VNQKPLRTTLAHPTPELPVEDVERAQQHYRDALGFEIGWLYPGAISVPSRAITSRFSFAEEAAHSNLLFTGYLRRTSTRLTRNCARGAHESLNRSRRSPGVCASSLWKISMETASIFTATDARRPIHEHQLASDLKPQSRRSPIPGDDQEKQQPTTLINQPTPSNRAGH